MLVFPVLPLIGAAVSSGVLGTNFPSGPENSGLISARKGARPVAVGPVTNTQLREALSSEKAYQRTAQVKFGSTAGHPLQQNR